MRYFLHYITLPLLLLFQQNVSAQAKIEASALPNKVGTGQYTTYRLVIENAQDVGKLELPDFDGFTIISGPSQESGISSINGNVTKYVGISYILSPIAPGHYKLPPVSAVIDGKVMQSSTVEIEVTRQPQTVPSPGFGPQGSGVNPFKDPEPGQEYDDFILKPGENVQEKIAKNMILKLETDKTVCFVGEPITATYNLYSRLRSESRLTQNPAFNGFSVVDMTNDNLGSGGVAVLNGRDYNVYVVRKAQLYPLQAGDFTLEPAALENNIEFMEQGNRNNSANDINDLFERFSGGNIIQEKVTLASKPASIIVKPLPEANKPASFRGAVGKFNLTAELPQKEFATNDMARVIINISGNGNLHMINAPELTWPDKAENFEPKVSESLNKMVIPISGNKSFEYPFSVSSEGNYTFPAQEFSYFDPATASYHTLRTQPINFTVTKKKNGVFKTKPGENSSMSPWQWIQEHKLLTGFLALIILLIISSLFRKTKKKTVVQPMPAPTVKTKADIVLEQNILEQKNPLAESEKCIYNDDCQTFYRVLHNEFTIFLKQRLSIDEAAPSTYEISKALDKNGIINGLAVEINQFLTDLDFKMYTPTSDNISTFNTYTKALSLTQQLNRELAGRS